MPEAVGTAKDMSIAQQQPLIDANAVRITQDMPIAQR